MEWRWIIGGVVGEDVPLYLGSRSTFPGGKLGGLQVGLRPDVHSIGQSFCQEHLSWQINACRNACKAIERNSWQA